MLINYDLFGGMEIGGTKQSTLKDFRSARDAYNTRLWNGSLRPYRTPKQVGSCVSQFILSESGAPVCTEGCADYGRKPCGAETTYSLVDGMLARDGATVGKARPTETPLVSVTGSLEGDSTRFRVLCLDAATGEYSPPSAITPISSPSYGDVVQLSWSGCKPYRVQALLTQSMTPQREIGKDHTEWVTVGDFTSPVAVFPFEPEGWALTNDGYDPNDFCDPPKMQCFVVNEDGFYVGWKDSFLFISERHEPSKFNRTNIKNLFAKITNVVTARQALYIATTKGVFVARLTPTKDGVQVSIVPTYENSIPLPNTLSTTSSGAMYSTLFGILAVDEAGRQPQNVSSAAIQEDEFERDWLPERGIVQRGVYYATQKDKSWLLDFPSPSGIGTEYGKLVRVDRLGDFQLAAKDGLLYYSDSKGTHTFDRGSSYLPAHWWSWPARMKARTGFSRYKVLGENLEGVKLSIYADEQLVFTDTLTESKICTLPTCVVGLRISARFDIPAKSEETIINQLQIATSVQEIARSE